MNYDIRTDAQKAYATKTAEKTQQKVQGNKVTIGTRECSADEQELKEIYKILRKPRSRKYMKALKMMDILSAEDEQLIAEMKKEAGIPEGEDMTFQPEDIETFKAKIANYVAEEIRKEEEALRKAEEERRKAEEEHRKDNILQKIISPCGLPGCIIHTITRSGEVLEHFNDMQVQTMESRIQKVRDIVMDYGGFFNWSCVEIYRKRLVHRTASGDTIQIIELNEEDWGE